MRKKKSLINMVCTLFSYFIALIFNFITQACIVNILGMEYTGINGLFSNILKMLSVAELGIGTTIVYKLYKPIAEGDIEKIKSWMQFYKICYRYVTLAVSSIGIILIPFVPKIIGNVNVNENIIVLYIISLLDIIFSYIMTYKRSLLYANQRNYIISIIHIFYIILMNITQIIVLTILKNYTLFLIVKIFYRLLENIIINIYVNIHYPYINSKANKIDLTEKKDIFNRVKAILLQKFSFVINKGIDNILISIFLGIISVGYYSNYNIIVTTIGTIIYQIVSSMTASVGNLLTENDIEKSYAIYKKINMFNSLITGIAVVGFGCVITPFVRVWLGNEYILSDYIVISFSIYIYTEAIRRTNTLYKEAAGICKEDRFMYIIMAIINLILSIILCKIIGMSGVILGTAISYMFLMVYSYPKYIYKTLFKKQYKEYFMENLKYLIFIIISFICSFVLCKNIHSNNDIIQILINIIISMTITLTIFILLFKNGDEFKFYLDMIKNVIKNVIKNIKNKKIK